MKKYIRYSKTIANKICKAIENDESLEGLARKYPNEYPDPSAVFKWTKKHPEFKEQYVEARRLQAHKFFEKYNYLVENPPEPTDDKANNNMLTRIWDRELRSLEFKILKIGKIFDAHTFSDKQAVEVDHKNQPQIVIQSYADASNTSSAGLTPDNVLDVVSKTKEDLETALKDDDLLN